MGPTWLTRPAASPESLAALRAAWTSLPCDYLAFLARSDGAEGDLGVEPGWFVVWPAAEAVGLSRQYGLPEFLPGFFAFGSDGGGGLFVLPLAPVGGSCPVLMVPAGDLAPESLVPVAGSFAEFEAVMGRTSPGA